MPSPIDDEYNNHQISECLKFLDCTIIVVTELTCLIAHTPRNAQKYAHTAHNHCRIIDMVLQMQVSYIYYRYFLYVVIAL